MFNRTLSVDLVRKNNTKNSAVSDPDDTDFADKATIVGVVVEGAIKKVAWGVGAYVVLDTIRKVAVAYMSAS